MAVSERPMLTLQQAFLTAGLNLHVDDLCTQSESSDPYQAPAIASTIVDHSFEITAPALGCHRAMKNVQVASSSTIVARILRRTYGPDSTELQASITMLGLDVAAGRAVRTYGKASKATTRWHTMQQRLRRVFRLRAASRHRAARHVIATGVLPAANVRPRCGACSITRSCPFNNCRSQHLFLPAMASPEAYLCLSTTISLPSRSLLPYTSTRS